MKKILCLLLLCALSVCLFAQFEKIDVKIGEEYSYDLKEYSTRVGELNANPLQEIFISYWMSYSTHYRVAFDSKSLKATQLIKDEKEIFGLNLPMLTYKMIGGKLYCFIQGKDHKTTKLIVCEVDMKTGDWKGAPKTIVSTEDDIYSLYADGSSNWTLTPFNFEYSMDKKRIVVHYRARNYTKVDGEKYAQIDYFILDVNLQKLAEGKILGAMPDNQVDRKYITSDSKNRLYIYNELRRDKKEGRKFQLHILSPNESKFKITEINTGEFPMQNVLMQENDKGEIYITGFTNYAFAFSQDKKMFLYKLGADCTSAKKITESAFITDEKKSVVHQGVKTFPYLCNIPHQLVCNPDGSFLLLYSWSTIALLPGADNTPVIAQVQPSFCAAKISEIGEVISRTEVASSFQPGLNNENMILDNEDIYFLSAPTDESKIWNLAINKIHNGKIESKVLLENISGISNITNIDQHTLLAEIVYKYSNKKLLVRKLVRITLI